MKAFRPEMIDRLLTALNPLKRKKPGAPAPSKVEVLRARPLRNPAVTWGPDKTGDMVIHVPLEKKGWSTRMGRFFPAPDTRHILLDDIGADVWELCDGENTIDAIRRQISAKYQLNHKEAEASLIVHLQQLAKRKLIVALTGTEEEPVPVEAPSKPLQKPRTGSRRKKKR
jgi:hypothetical protein